MTKREASWSKEKKCVGCLRNFMPEVFQSQKTEIYLYTPESHHARQSSKTARVQVVRLVTLASLMSPTSA